VNIFVGNLSFEAKESAVQKAFASFGKVDSIEIVMDKNGKKSRGFGFVQMPDEQEALAAISALHGKEILGRAINVMAALSKKRQSQSDDHKKNDVGGSFVLKRTGKYKEGRRTISYMKRRIGAGITTPVVEREFKANPLRWRKKSKWATPYQKPQGELKVWRKAAKDRVQTKFKKPGRFSKA
jgi:RNA recognition motif-containing protein